MSETKIQWTDRTWNPVRGCSRVSEGCRNCYAERMAGRFTDGPFAGFVTRVNGEARWTGKVALVPEKLDEPLRWRKPSRVFVNSMSGLFHEALPDEAIDRVFAVMALAPRHTFQVLTKRPERMREHLSDPERKDRIEERIAFDAADWHAGDQTAALGGRWVPPEYEDGRVTNQGYFDGVAIPWPLPNVHLGVSVEDQRAADERIPLLLQTPAALRFLSVEPLLGSIDIERWLWDVGGSTAGPWRDPLGRVSRPSGGGCGGQMISSRPAGLLGWVIVGGESGPKARPCDVAWIRGVVEQCKAAGTACFVKQMGARIHGLRCECGAWPSSAECFEYGSALAHHRGHDSHALPCGPVTPAEDHVRDPKGGDPEEWPADLRVREFPVARVK